VYVYYIYLALAIICEVVGTLALKSSEQFTRLGPSTLVVLGYGGAFYCLSLCLRVLPVGLIYAIWSGVGIVLVSIIAWFLFKQKLDFPAIVGMSLIVVGVVVINLFSKSVPH